MCQDRARLVAYLGHASCYALKHVVVRIHLQVAKLPSGTARHYIILYHAGGRLTMPGITTLFASETSLSAWAYSDGNSAALPTHLMTFCSTKMAASFSSPRGSLKVAKVPISCTFEVQEQSQKV